MSAGLDMIYDTLDFFLGKKPSINNRKYCETCADCGKKYPHDVPCVDCLKNQGSGEEDYSEGPQTRNREYFGLKNNAFGGYSV